MWECWRIRDQLDVTIYEVLFHFVYAQHVSDINTCIIRSLRLFYCITTLVVCSCFDVCWSFGVAGWGGIRVAGWSCTSACNCAQHVLDINTSIIRSLRLFYCITTLVVFSCFDVCWSFVVAGWGGRRLLMMDVLMSETCWAQKKWNKT